ncbi:MAG: hypothetical protein AAF519_20455 [Bacteroidota bacterium]
MDYVIPLTDIFTVIENILNLSNSKDINEIEIPALAKDKAYVIEGYLKEK